MEHKSNDPSSLYMGYGAALVAQPIGMQQSAMMAAGAGHPSMLGQGVVGYSSRPTDGEFKCAHCGSEYVTSPHGRGGSTRRKVDPKNPSKRRKPRPARPRTAVIDGKKVQLCNACGIHWQRKHTKRQIKPVRRTYARKKRKASVPKESSPFYQAVISVPHFSADADFFWCDCGQQCTGKYLMSPDGKLKLDAMDELLQIHKKALALKRVKNYGRDSDKNNDRGGYGKGHQSSKEYEAFVFQQIEQCKQHKLCGRFRKRLLSFSNDWLYKRPTVRSNDPMSGMSKGKPRALLEKKFELSPDEFKTAMCCNKLCCRKIWVNQIAKWRKDYVEGNSEQRWHVVQQMLLGEGNGSSKCVRVVRLVTGCSRNLVTAVSHYLRVNECMGPPPQSDGKMDMDDGQQGGNSPVLNPLSLGVGGMNPLQLQNQYQAPPSIHLPGMVHSSHHPVLYGSLQQKK